jgi:hypothetical protein
MLDASYFNMRAVVAEHDAVVLCAKAIKGRDDVLETFHVAFFGIEESAERVQDLNSDVLGDGAQIGLCSIGEDDALSHF